MTYQPNVPLSGNSLGQTRPIINTNFVDIDLAFRANHVPMTTNNTGYHTHVDMTAQAANPNPIATLVSHYSKQVAGITEWFFQREAPGSQVIQMSRLTPVPLSQGFTFLPGGLLLQWGSFSVPFVNPITFPVPFTGVPFSVQVTSNNINGTGAGLISATGFTALIFLAPGSAATWMAVGV